VEYCAARNRLRCWLPRASQSQTTWPSPATHPRLTDCNCIFTHSLTHLSIRSISLSIHVHQKPTPTPTRPHLDTRCHHLSRAFLPAGDCACPHATRPFTAGLSESRFSSEILEEQDQTYHVGGPSWAWPCQEHECRDRSTECRSTTAQWNAAAEFCCAASRRAIRTAVTAES
jgi:hypothetical protein